MQILDFSYYMQRNGKIQNSLIKHSVTFSGQLAEGVCCFPTEIDGRGAFTWKGC